MLRQMCDFAVKKNTEIRELLELELVSCMMMEVDVKRYHYHKTGHVTQAPTDSLAVTF